MLLPRRPKVLANDVLEVQRSHESCSYARNYSVVVRLHTAVTEHRRDHASGTDPLSMSGIVGRPPVNAHKLLPVDVTYEAAR